MNLEEKVKELEQRVAKIELQVLGKRNKGSLTYRLETGPQLQLEMLKFPDDILTSLQEQIRKVSYWNLIVLLLYFAPRPLKYADIMNLSAELRKPVSYNWLNTEFHRDKYSGLVRSEPIHGSTEKVYVLNEPGRRRAEIFITKLKAARSK